MYEVFRIKIKKAEEVFGKIYPKREVYPPSEDFGMTAWAYHNEKLARQRYEVL